MAAISWLLKSFNELTNEELYSVMRLRQEVFVVEQNCPFVDADDKDQASLHLLGSIDSHLAAYARIVPPGLAYREVSIGRVVTSEKYRKQGWGKELMQEAIKVVECAYGHVPVRIGAQQYLQRFYEDFGFQQQGQSYLEDGILHIIMLRQI